MQLSTSVPRRCSRERCSRSEGMKAEVLQRVEVEHPEADHLAGGDAREQTDMIDLPGDALTDLAEIFELADRRPKRPRPSSRRSHATNAGNIIEANEQRGPQLAALRRKASISTDRSLLGFSYSACSGVPTARSRSSSLSAARGASMPIATGASARARTACRPPCSRSRRSAGRLVQLASVPKLKKRFASSQVVAVWPKNASTSGLSVGSTSRFGKIPAFSGPVANSWTTNPGFAGNGR